MHSIYYEKFNCVCLYQNERVFLPIATFFFSISSTMILLL